MVIGVPIVALIKAVVVTVIPVGVVQIALNHLQRLVPIMVLGIVIMRIVSVIPVGVEKIVL